MAEDQDNSRLEQAFLLVGRFMFNWAYVEYQITKGIKELLKLEAPQADIILANVTLRDKTSMLSTFAHLILGDGEPSTKAFKLIERIVKFSSNYRNILVHNASVANEKDGIIIYRVKAKGKYEVPDIVWTKSFFEKLFLEMDQYDDQLKELLAGLKRQDGIKRVAKALASTRVGSAQLSPLGRLMNLHPSSGGYSPLGTIQEPCPQTPETPPPKRKAVRKK